VGYGGPNQWYFVTLVEADEAATRVLSALLQKWAAQGSYPGIPGIMRPTGLVERHRIRVTKVD
jgi:hypothetical protein